MPSPVPLRILHVLRAPVGGLFRHVVDLARGQVELGHEVGIVCDATTGGERAEAALAALRGDLVLGVTRLPMARLPGAGDIASAVRVRALVSRLGPDVVHGHGAKGGLYARLCARADGRRPARIYTPHGGSFHYPPGTMQHRLYMTAERILARRTDFFLFESAYIARLATSALGSLMTRSAIVYNGLHEAEFNEVSRSGTHDVLYIGELRHLKGIDTLIDALALLRDEGRPLTAVFVGAGPDEEAIRAHAARRGLDKAVTFRQPMPIREAMALARVMVVPSRAESLPYVVLEAAAAAMPLVATAVGGIPEIFGPQASRLVPPDAPEALAGALRRRLDMPEAEAHAEDAALRAFVRERFSLPQMIASVLEAYRTALR
ncbi:glycosyltransferase family 4 protein [Chelatococcus composti]|jgi:glycosyltransferase involved in cell wall biosynthesis|uniref:Glycosyltransferase involved in cell wall biosynthesis n=1 Tax=Chelatococcus composti TaxID=1743235 RepID=A0A841KEC8_9HYPH|nr:glycosyltransferase family 4 protein [Chelatococcus composti]MBB6169304.1 glycosyltransferase involved in cell wall biosynthesis [Chelatococcus composti]MBS7736872.1 glycosyltransferase family 4 protein [Chelatococcus composti]GGG46752.1 transferase [Chelatococcus composti]